MASERIDRPAMDRATSEAALEEAALELLEETGVLAGLNLREVADRAGLNRGLVYHYFGSRRELLRAALRRNATARLSSVSAAEDLPFRERMREIWRTLIRYSRDVRLATLLFLDGEASVRLTPLRGQTLKRLQEDQRAGAIRSDLDLDGFHAVLFSLISGYAIYRKGLAKTANLPLRELDEKAEAVWELFVGVAAGDEGKDGR